MHNESCPTCRWFEDLHVKEAPILPLGRCRARPPVPVADPEDGGSMTCWPIVDGEDYCGEWTRRREDIN